MPLISPCLEQGCTKLCMGLFCIEHELRPAVEFVRGRPWPPVGRVAQAVAPRLPAVATQARVRVRPAA
jgi:hypothetical protein